MPHSNASAQLLRNIRVNISAHDYLLHILFYQYMTDMVYRELNIYRYIYALLAIK